MGADAVYFYYGVRRTIAFDNEEQVRQLEDDSHPIYTVAFDHKLHVTWGRLTDGADYFMLIGYELGRFGVEGLAEHTFTEAQLAVIVAQTKVSLQAAGIHVPPTFYVQLHAQY